ncbi:MAG: hypothetical protein ACUVSQ_07175 [Pseudanabaenaceae cyanobacterium]
MNEDHRLVYFLQRHKPAPPPAPSQAEAQLMQALAELPSDRPSERAVRVSLGVLLGLVMAALATGWWVGQRRAIALAEAERLETILLEEWNASLALADAFYVDFVRDERP